MSRLAGDSATVAADGTALVIFGPVPPGQVWLVETLTVSLSTGNGRARVYEGQVADESALIEGTESGEQDTTARLDRLSAGDALAVRWTGATAGATARALLRGRSVSER